MTSALSIQLKCSCCKSLNEKFNLPNLHFYNLKKKLNTNYTIYFLPLSQILAHPSSESLKLLTIQKLQILSLSLSNSIPLSFFLSFFLSFSLFFYNAFTLSLFFSNYLSLSLSSFSLSRSLCIFYLSLPPSPFSISLSSFSLFFLSILLFSLTKKLQNCNC